MNFRIWVSLLITLPLPLLAHPGSLDEYPERIAGKSLQNLLAAWEPKPEGAWSDFQLVRETYEIADDWISEEGAVLRQRITDLQKRNREGDYRKRVANALNDMLDLLSHADGQSQAAADYLHWRLARMELDDGFLDPQEPSDWMPDQAKAEWKAHLLRAHQDSTNALENGASAPEFLRPHWLVMAGAIQLRARKYEEAYSLFGQVIDRYPTHPRAEVAAIMRPVTKIQEWKTTTNRQVLTDARTGLKIYRKTYPRGRFLADLPGWEAGLEVEEGNVSGAVELYLQQARQPEHPEVRRRALQQLERLLPRIAEHPQVLEEAFPWEAVAREPLAALRFGYFLLDPMSEVDLGAIMRGRDGDDHRALERLTPTLQQVRAAAIVAWPRFEAALRAEPNAYQHSAVVIRNVLLAWATIQRGAPEGAVSLLDPAWEGAGADDALYALAVAAQRDGDFDGAVRLLEQLEARYPASPLHRDIGFRLAQAQLGLDRPGEAVRQLGVMLAATNGVAEPREFPTESPPLHLLGEVVQWIATLLTYAPTEALETLLKAPGLHSGLEVAMSSALRTRYFAREDFEAFHRVHYPESFLRVWTVRSTRRPMRTEADPAAWQPFVRELQALYQAAEEAPTPAAKAAGWCQAGARWEEAEPWYLDGGAASVRQGVWHGQAVLPSPSHQVRRHAALLHRPDAVAARLLDDRNEITHGIRCYERALDLAPKGSPESLQALLALHAALRTRALLSPYCLDRAAEQGDSAYSKRLYDRIRDEHAGTAQAQQVVWWTFRPASELKSWRPWGPVRTEGEVAALLANPPGKPATLGDNWEWRRFADEFREGLQSGADDTAWREHLRLMRLKTKHDFRGNQAALYINHCDDLELLLNTPDLPRSIRDLYAVSRLDGKTMTGDLTGPTAKPIADLVAFWNYLSVSSEIRLTDTERLLPSTKSYRMRLAQVRVCRMTQFLADFPESRKREAATARLAINTVRQSRCHCGMDRQGGFVIERGIPFDPSTVFAALDRYDQEFPNGRYQWDVRLARGIALSEAGDLRGAGRIFVEILNTPDQADLHVDASNNFCEILIRLLDPASRSAVIDLFAHTQQAWDKLWRFMESESCGWQLRFLEDWLHSESRRGIE